MNQLIRCINCNEIYLKTPFDQCPEYEFKSFPSMENLHDIERNDFQELLEHHCGHRLEDLRIIEDSYISEKAYSEPIKASYFKATNGKEKSLIKKFRERIEDPLKYELFAKDYSLVCTAIEIQSKEITRQLNKEFKAGPLPQFKIDAFLKLFKHIASTLAIDKLERIPEESLNPLEVYYKMDDVSLAFLLRNCYNIFNGQDYLDIVEFIHDNKDDGVLLFKATYQIQFTERVFDGCWWRWGESLSPGAEE